MVGKPKSGKSTLARYLSVKVSRGEEFLGRQTARGSVIYLALEEKRSEVAAHFRDMGVSGDEEVFIHAAHAPQDALPEVIEATKRLKPALIIIDPLLKFTRLKDANDYAAVTLALEPLLILARQSGAHLLVVHHLGKAERAEASDSILGSTAFFASVDTAMILKRREQARTIQTSQR